MEHSTTTATSATLIRELIDRRQNGGSVAVRSLLRQNAAQRIRDLYNDDAVETITTAESVQDPGDTFHGHTTAASLANVLPTQVLWGFALHTPANGTHVTELSASWTRAVLSWVSHGSGRDGKIGLPDSNTAEQDTAFDFCVEELKKVVRGDALPSGPVDFIGERPEAGVPYVRWVAFDSVGFATTFNPSVSSEPESESGPSPAGSDDGVSDDGETSASPAASPSTAAATATSAASRVESADKNMVGAINTLMTNAGLPTLAEFAEAMAAAAEAAEAAKGEIAKVQEDAKAEIAAAKASAKVDIRDLLIKRDGTVTETPTEADATVNTVDAWSVFKDAPGIDGQPAFKTVMESISIPQAVWAVENDRVPEVDELHVFDAHALIKLLVAMSTGKNARFVGPTGCGKTTTSLQVAARLGLPVARVNFDEGVTRDLLMGSKDMVVDDKGNSKTVLTPGVVSEAYGHMGILILDEYDAIEGDTAYAMMPVLEGKPLTLMSGAVEDRIIKKHPLCFIVGTGNTNGLLDESGLYGAGVKTQSVANVDRWPMTIKIDYLPQNVETTMLGNIVSKEWAQKLATYATRHREAFKKGEIEYPLSLRRLRDIADTYNAVAPSSGTRLESRKEKAMAWAFECFVADAMTVNDSVACKGIAERTLYSPGTNASLI